MKFLVEKYKVVSVWLSLAILALGFYIGANQECRDICVPFTFLLGMVMYLSGCIYEWRHRRRFAGIILLILTLLMAAGMVFSVFGWGGPD
ncbi:MAG: hypothetical protein IKV59_05905 [Lachnospiraceae bacterium]|nr:hypothetical protein [Lachnospiraceae bacterium]